MDIDKGTIWESDNLAIQQDIIEVDVEVIDDVGTLIFTGQMRIHVDFPSASGYHLKGRVVKREINVRGLPFLRRFAIFHCDL